MRTLRRAVLPATLVTLSVFVGGAPAQAGTARGPEGQQLTATPSTGVSRSGATVTVSGRGYDTAKGIYVAFCVDNGAGQAPGPCGGGADMSGSLGASHWISSNPPAYGEGLATPYGSGGTFRVTLKVDPTIGDVDCTTRRCVVATRADHTRSADRSQDVRVPVTFAAAPAPSRPGTAPTTSGGTGTTGGSGSTGGGAAPTGGTGATGGGATTAAVPPAAGGSAAPTAAGTPGAVPADPGATSAGAAGGPSADVQVTRVSAASDLGVPWWTVALGAPVLLGMLLIGLRRRRRRGPAR